MRNEVGRSDVGQQGKGDASSGSQHRRAWGSAACQVAALGGADCGRQRARGEGLVLRSERRAKIPLEDKRKAKMLPTYVTLRKMFFS